MELGDGCCGCASGFVELASEQVVEEGSLDEDQLVQPIHPPKRGQSQVTAYTPAIRLEYAADVLMQCQRSKGGSLLLPPTRRGMGVLRVRRRVGSSRARWTGRGRMGGTGGFGHSTEPRGAGGRRCLERGCVRAQTTRCGHGRRSQSRTQRAGDGGSGERTGPKPGAQPDRAVVVEATSTRRGGPTAHVPAVGMAWQADRPASERVIAQSNAAYVRTRPPLSTAGHTPRPRLWLRGGLSNPSATLVGAGRAAAAAGAWSARE